MPVVPNKSSLSPYPMDAPLPHRIQIDLSGGDFTDNTQILTLLGAPGTKVGNTTSTLRSLAQAKGANRKYARVTRFMFQSGLEFGGDRPFAHPVAGFARVELDDPMADFNRHNTDSVFFPPPPNFSSVDDKRIEQGMTIRFDLPASDFDIDSADRERLPDSTIVRVFDRFPLWQGTIESVVFVPQMGGHQAIITALGPLAEYSREHISMPARVAPSAILPLQAGEIIRDIIATVHGIDLTDPQLLPKVARYASTTSLATGDADSGLQIWYAEDETNALLAIEQLLDATGSIVFEGRRGKLQYRTRDSHPIAERIRNSQAMLVDRSPKKTSKIATEVADRDKRIEVRSRTSSDIAAGIDEPIVYVQSVEAQVAEDATLTRITYPRLTMRHENDTIWQQPDPIVLDAGENTVVSIYADNAQQGTVGITIWNQPLALTAGQIAWTDPSDTRIPSGAVPNPARVTLSLVFYDVNDILRIDSVGNRGMNLRHLLEVKYEPFASEPQAGVTITGMELTGDQIIVQQHEIQEVKSNYNRRRTEHYPNKFIEETLTQAGRKRQTPVVISNLEEAMRDIINLYEVDAFRPIVQIDGASAGRWAVEELLVPHSRVTLYLPFAGYSSHSYHVRSVSYESEEADNARLTLQLQPVRLSEFRLSMSALDAGDGLGETS